MNMGNRVQVRHRDGRDEHRHDYYKWWHPVTRIHETKYMLECNIGCFGEMWTCIDRNVEVLEKEMQQCLREISETRSIEDRKYWMKEVLRLSTWGIVPIFTVDDQKQQD